VHMYMCIFQCLYVQVRNVCTCACIFKCLCVQVQNVCMCVCISKCSVCSGTLCVCARLPEFVCPATLCVHVCMHLQVFVCPGTLCVCACVCASSSVCVSASPCAFSFFFCPLCPPSCACPSRRVLLYMEYAIRPCSNTSKHRNGCCLLASDVQTATCLTYLLVQMCVY